MMLPFKVSVIFPSMSFPSHGMGRKSTGRRKEALWRVLRGASLCVHGPNAAIIQSQDSLGVWQRPMMLPIHVV